MIKLESKLLIPQDKANHFIYGLILAIIGAIIFAIIGLNFLIGAIVFSVVFGALKELYDKYSGKGDPDIRDFLATCAGVLPIVICRLFI